jgi:hypothetical protein
LLDKGAASILQEVEYKLKTLVTLVVGIGNV